MKNWFGKECAFLSAQWEDSEYVAGPNWMEFEPILKFCAYPENPEDTEGNCREDICPLNKRCAWNPY